MKRILLFTVLLHLRLLAVDVVYEGRWLVDGKVMAGADSSCAMLVYADSEAKTKLAERAGLPLRTDADGYFAVAAGFSVSADVFYVTVQPQSGKAVMPLQRVAPCPYAIVADSVEVVTNSSGVVAAGTLSASTLAVSGNLEAGDVTLSGVTFSATDMAVSNVTFASYTVGNGGSMQFFNPCNSSWRPTVSYDDFVADHVAKVENFPSQGGVMDFPKFTFEGDGLVQIFAKGVIQHPLSRFNSQHPYVNVTIAGVKMLDGLVLDDGTNAVSRLMTYPYRDGDVLELGLPCYNHGDSSAPAYNYTEAKIKFVKFGLD